MDDVIDNGIESLIAQEAVIDSVIYLLNVIQQVQPHGMVVLAQSVAQMASIRSSDRIAGGLMLQNERPLGRTDQVADVMHTKAEIVRA